MRQRLASLEASITSLTDAKEASEDKAFGLTHRVATLEERDRDLTELLAARGEQIARLETERDLLKQRLEAERDLLRQQFASERDTLEKQLATERQRSLDLERREAELREHAADLRARVASLEGELEAVRSELEQRREALRVLEPQEVEERQNAADLREQVATLETERDALKRELADQEQPTELEQEGIAELEQRIAKESEALRAAETQLRRTETGKATVEADRNRVEAQYRHLLARMEDLQRSRSYRLMRWLWRVKAAIRRPFRRRSVAGTDQTGATSDENVKPAPVKRPDAAKKPPRGKEAASAKKTAASRETAAPKETTAPEPSAPQEQEPERVAAARAAVKDQRDEWLAAAARAPMDIRDLRLAGVVDEISRSCFEPDCQLLTFGSDDWEEQLEAHQPQLLLVESAWQGNNGSWQYQVATYDHPDHIGLPKLRELVRWCRERGIPTAFWNKEDPVHFERFREAAALFDHIFTTDSDRIADYEALEREGEGGVHALQFAAQPRLHNPIAASGPRSDSPCFAGAYYRDRHVDRRRSLEMLLDAAAPFGLVIYDRTMGSADDAFGFPERFRSCIKGGLPYPEMIEAYKAHKVFLNANSVVDSPTMFSRRIFELLACDTAVVSTASLGVAETFGELVPIVETPDEVREALKRLLEDDDARRDLTIRGRRLVLSRHTYRHRLAAIASAAGFPVSPDIDERVAAIALVDDLEQARRVRALVSAISGQSLPPAELLIGVGADTPMAGDLQQLSAGDDELRVRIVPQEQGAARAQRYRELGALATSPWVGVLHPQHEYGEHHLMDLVLTTRYTDADVIGSATFDLLSRPRQVKPKLQGRFVDLVHPHSALVSRDLVATRGWPDETPGSWQTLHGWFREGVRFFSVDASNFRADPALGEPPRIAPLESSDVG
jgi:Glycosyl transferases group 1